MSSEQVTGLPASLPPRTPQTKQGKAYYLGHLAHPHHSPTIPTSSPEVHSAAFSGNSALFGAASNPPGAPPHRGSVPFPAATGRCPDTAPERGRRARDARQRRPAGGPRRAGVKNAINLKKTGDLGTAEAARG